MPLAKLFAGQADQDGGRRLDPRLQVLLGLQRRAKMPGLTAGTVASARERYAAFCASAETHRPPVAHQALTLPGPSGSELQLRIYHPAAFSRPLPVLLYLHGGGFVIGDLETHRSVCERLAVAGGMAVAALDYRLAPEHPLPAALDDCAYAIDGLRAQSAALALDGERMAVGGDSAGANLAAVTSQGRDLRFQLLYYPVTEAGAKTGSKERFAMGYGLSVEDIGRFEGHYAGHIAHGDPRLSPRFSESLNTSPPTRLVVAGFDVLRDEGRQFAGLLRDAGVSVDLVERSEWIHGFIHMGILAGVPAALHEDGRAVGDALRA